MVGIPHAFFKRECERDLDIELPPAGEYAMGNVFFKKDDPGLLADQKAQFETMAEKLGLRVLGWREVPTDSTILGPASLSREPIILQPSVVLAASFGPGNKPDPALAGSFDEKYFERQLYVLRKHATHTLTLASGFYICSLSNKNVVYKGQLAPVQVYNYYHDLNHVLFASHFCLVHSRFSTNTFPSWDRAQPMRWAAHNGEINTVRGNKNWMRAREGVLQSSRFADELDMLYPIVEAGGSDSAAFDNVLELLVVNSVITLPEAVMMMVPEAWQDNDDMDPAKVAFYQWAACLMEPWDGPALFTFSDGRYCGATLDRNGLRPCRWVTTSDDIMICASEVGTISLEPEKVTRKGRLQPGKMLLVDTVEGKIVDDKELKMSTAAKRPFAEWMSSYMLRLPKIIEKERAKGQKIETTLDDSTVATDPRLLAFGYTFEQMDLLLRPMVTDSKEALGSMGNDAPLACMATAPRVIYDYFRQLFAQVTNPPIDPIRESIVMSLECYVGAEGNLLSLEPKQCRRLALPSPVLTIEEVKALKELKAVQPTWPARVIDITFDKREGVAGYERALTRICQEASQAIDDDSARVVILSDRNVSAERVPISAVVACGGVHHHLIGTKQRSKIALIVETGEAKEVHHICVLVGYGADGVCSYLAIEAMLKLRREGLLKKDMSEDEVIDNFKGAANNGILKVMSKMGISTLSSYKGAQIFEILGLHQSVVDRCFLGTASRIQGATFELLAMDAFELHERGFPSRETILPPGLPESGEYHWRNGGEAHINDPTGIAKLQDAVREKNQKSYDEYAANAHKQVCAYTHTLSLSLSDVSRLTFAATGPRRAPPWLARLQLRRSRGDPDRAGRALARDCQALRHGRHVVRLHLDGVALGPRRRHEPPRRQVQHGRRWRGRRALQQAPQRRHDALGHQADRLGPLWRHVQLPRRRRRAPDQDGPGRQAGRGRRAPWPQGLAVDRKDAPLDRRRRPHLAAASPRHLLDRGPQAAHLRPQVRQPALARLGQARLRGRRRRRRLGCRQGQGGPHPHLGPRRWHGRLALDRHQVRRPAVGARPRRDAPDARPQRPPWPRHRPDRRPNPHRPRRRHRLLARRRRVGLCHHASVRLHSLSALLSVADARERAAASRWAAS